MDYTYIYNIINNYLIDKDIIINENDNFNNKLKYFLLKYKRIIAIILLIIILFIGYQCDLHFLDINNNDNDNDNDSSKHRQNILHGGYESYKSRFIAPKAKALGSSIKSGAIKSVKAFKPKNLYKFGEQRAADAKEMAPQFYGLIYSIAITGLMFLIFMPAVGFLILGIVCYSLLRDKISAIKGL
jgi:hypothetical protein